MFVEHDETAGDVVAVEKFRGQYDDAFDEVGFDEAFADDVLGAGALDAPVVLQRLLGLVAKQDALRHHNDGFAGWLQRFHDLLHPSVIAVVAGRHPEGEPVVRVTTGKVAEAPILEREGRIHHNPVKLSEPAGLAFAEIRRAQAVAGRGLAKAARANAVQVHVDTGDVGRGGIALLHVEEQPLGSFLTVATLDVVAALE